MIQLSCRSCNACQILPWVLRSIKVNYIKFVRRFVLKIEVKTAKGHRPFEQGSNFKFVRFHENGLKLIRLPCKFRKCIVSYTVNVPILVKGGSKFNGHRPYMGIDLWPFDSHTSWLPRYAKLYFFLIILVIQSIWAHFRWNRTNLKIWPPVKRSMTFC